MNSKISLGNRFLHLTSVPLPPTLVVGICSGGKILALIWAERVREGAVEGEAKSTCKPKTTSKFPLRLQKQPQFFSYFTREPLTYPLNYIHCFIIANF